MPKGKSRIVIDTNLWISFLLTKDFSAFDKFISTPNLTLLFSSELLEEFIEVAQRPKFKKYFSPSDLEELLLKTPPGQFFKVVHSFVLYRVSQRGFPFTNTG